VTQAPPNPLDPNAWVSLLESFGLQAISGDAQAAQAITWDSRNTNPHTAFAALPGETTHGNAFIEIALERGAPFVLTDQDVPKAVRVTDATATLRGWARAWRDESHAQIIGITGSAGKTTAKEFVAAALNCGKTPGNLNTLNAIACYLLSVVQPKSTHVIEMGIDRIGEMDQLVKLVNPDLGVVVAVGPAHLEFLGSLEGVAFEKGRIFADRAGLVSESAAPYYPKLESYGFGAGITHRALNLELTDSSATYTFHGHPIHVSSPSAKVAEASVLGLVLAQRFGVNLQDAISRIADVDVPGGRMRIERGQYTLIDDAYNANPLSVNAALDVLERQAGRKIAVLGDMRELGEASETYHVEIGRRAGKVAQVVIAVGRWASVLARAASESGAKTVALETVPDAISEVSALLEPSDTVLVKGSLSVGLGKLSEVIRARL
jgi:UDP-N-acetylmuramoyl-tripeptide--D-alanyl-D-alanine ligase